MTTPNGTAALCGKPLRATPSAPCRTAKDLHHFLGHQPSAWNRLLEMVTSPYPNCGTSVPRLRDRQHGDAEARGLVQWNCLPPNSEAGRSLPSAWLVLKDSADRQIVIGMAAHHGGHASTLLVPG